MKTKRKRIALITIANIVAVLLVVSGMAIGRSTSASTLYRKAFTPQAGRAAGAVSAITDVATEADIAAGPTIGPITVQTPGPIEKYARFEVSFDITNATATNVYFPYDENTPPGVESGIGITVDALLLPPGETDWNNAQTLICFYHQPVEQVGSGGHIALLPTGQPDWRCRFTPDGVGVWQYKIRATDAGGTTETETGEFTAINSNRKGFIKVSATDTRFFEFADGTPFVTPLVNVEQGNPFNSLAEIRENVANMGEGGVRFVRWFPTGEGANFFVAPFGDTIKINWGFGDSHSTPDDADTEAGKRFSFAPYYYSSQNIPGIPGAKYRLSFRANITGERVLRAHTGISDGTIDICSGTSTYHESNGNDDTCTYKQDGWNDYSIEATNASATVLYIALRGLYVSSDAPSPYNVEQDGKIRTHSIRLQRDETGNGDWGPNLLTRSDPDTYNYVDQRSAARLDEILRLSEQYGVYHKLTLFHKNGAILNRFQPDGTIGDWGHCGWGSCPKHFYSADGEASRWYQRAYTRYFIGRWSYSPALHSLELANENDLYAESYDAGFAVAEYVHNTSPRHILMSNSFWGWFVSDFWTDPDRGSSMDYADKHWYADESGSDCDGGVCEFISNTWTDSAAYVRECRNRFQDYKERFDYHKPIVRGEGGVAESGTAPQHPDVATDPQGTYYHKKVWAHVGVSGYSCDGDWYPRLFVPDNDDQFPNGENDLYDIFSAYERFMQDERVNSGNYQEVGTDLTGTQQITLTNLTGDLRAWGVRDGISGRVLLWIDNANHTWKNVVDGVSISPAGGTLTIQGLPQGIYTAEWWDTRSGQVTGTETAGYTVGSAAGDLSFSLIDLETDLAVKFIRQSDPDFSPSYKAVSPGYADYGERITYTVVIRNATGPLINTIRFTDTLQDGLSYVPGTLTATTGTIIDTAAPILYWSGVLTPTPVVTITYAATIIIAESKSIVNVAELSEAGGESSTATTIVIANPYLTYLPLIVKGD